MTEPGATTPLQPVGRGSGRRPVLAGAALLALLGLLVWQPWAGPDPAGRRAAGPSASAVSGLPAGSLDASGGTDPPAATGPSPTPDGLPGPTPAPTTGQWTGRIPGRWSIVAFLREDLLSHDPLAFVQQPVAVWPLAGIGTAAGAQPGSCDERPSPGLAGGAILPAGGVRLLGIAFPDGRAVTVTRIVGLPDDMSADPFDLGTIGADPASLPPVRPRASVAPGSPDGAVAGRDPVRLFALPGGVRWPDGTYRFEIATRDGLPGALYACIR